MTAVQVVEYHVAAEPNLDCSYVVLYSVAVYLGGWGRKPHNSSDSRSDEKLIHNSLPEEIDKEMNGQ